MKTKSVVAGVVIFGLCAISFSFAQQSPKVGGFEQIPPEARHGQDIGAGWGHRSMTFGMMNLMSGMTSQVATMIRSEKTTPAMRNRMAEILEHVAEMMNYAPAYMMGTKKVDTKMINEMQEMLKDLAKMRKEMGMR